jgi:lipopolysaccharide transport system ATP-binding protein
MYVRLAFAVAAHLEPEILIVDEVLAVGDAEFQKKCLGKMKDVSVNQGRTVLFVSHNMAAIRSLCSKAVLLKHGRLLLEGESNFVISEYFNSGTSVSVTVSERVDRLGNQKFKFTDIIMMNEEGMTVNEVISGAYVRFKIFADCTDDINPGKILFGLNFIDQFDQVVLSFLSDEMGGFQFSREKGFFELVIPDLFLRADKYYIKLISFYQSTNEDDTLDIIENCMQVQVLSGDFWATGKINRGGSYSIIPGHFIS